MSPDEIKKFETMAMHAQRTLAEIIPEPISKWNDNIVVVLGILTATPAAARELAYMLDAYHKAHPDEWCDDCGAWGKDNGIIDETILCHKCAERRTEREAMLEAAQAEIEKVKAGFIDMLNSREKANQ